MVTTCSGDSQEKYRQAREPHPCRPAARPETLGQVT
jgi:hypothetical protein